MSRRRTQPPAHWYGDAPVPAAASVVAAVYGVVAGLRRWLEAAGEQLSDAALTRTMLSLSPGERMTLGEHWPLWTNPGQEEPRASRRS